MTASAALILLAISAGTPAHADCGDPAGAPVASIVISGTESADESAVRTALGLTPGDVVAPAALAGLESRILETGWFATASAVLGRSDDGANCVLRVRLVEYGSVREVRIVGASVIGGEALREGLRTQPETAANRQIAGEDARAIALRYLEGGYEAARVTGFDIEGGVVTFHVSEGRIARVEVRGARLTGANRVRKVLAIEAGDVYSSRALTSGQAALYRTGLFSVVGFGVEPLEPDAGETAEDRLVLTVTVTEHRNPYSRTEIFSGQGDGPDGELRGFSVAAVDARLRNVGRGNSLRASLDLLAPAPDALAGSGFDEFYRLHARGELGLFRPEASAGGAVFALDVERVHGRERSDLGRTVNSDSPAVSAAIEVPLLAAERVSGLGGFSGTAGWRRVHSMGVSTGVLEDRPDYDGIFGRGEIGADLQDASGLAEPISALRVRAGLEMHDSLETFSYLTAEGRSTRRLGRGQRLAFSGDLGILSGDVPFWCETALGGHEGPLGYGPEIAFARRHARGRIEYSISARGDFAGVGTGLSGAAWSDAGPGSEDLHSAFLELRLGPEFARFRAGVALPLREGPDGEARRPWFHAALTIATPY